MSAEAGSAIPTAPAPSVVADEPTVVRRGRRLNPPLIVGAAIVVAVITIFIDFLFARLQRAVTPRGLKLAETRPSVRRRFPPLSRRRLETT